MAGLGVVGRRRLPNHSRYGLFLAAGPIMAALVGAGAGGVVGGLAGGLAGLGWPKTEPIFCRTDQRCGTLLSIHSDNSHWWKRAEEILEVTELRTSRLPERRTPNFPTVSAVLRVRRELGQLRIL